MGLPDETMRFLEDLAHNNSKDWFDENRKRYERDLKKPGRALVDEVNSVLETLAPEWVTPSGKAISRINRDIRFSKDKTPYNTRLWAGFHKQGAEKGAAAAYYFGLSPTGCGMGCGAWMPPKPHIDRLRAHIATHHVELTSMLATLSDQGFGALDGDRYKRVPKPFDADHPAGDYLKHRGFHVRIELDPEIVTTDAFVPEIAARFTQLKPLVDFLQAGLD